MGRHAKTSDPWNLKNKVAGSKLSDHTLTFIKCKIPQEGQNLEKPTKPTQHNKVKSPAFNGALNQQLNEESLDFDSGLASVIVTLLVSVLPQ